MSKADIFLLWRHVISADDAEQRGCLEDWVNFGAASLYYFAASRRFSDSTSNSDLQRAVRSASRTLMRNCLLLRGRVSLPFRQCHPAYDLPSSCGIRHSRGLQSAARKPSNEKTISPLGKNWTSNRRIEIASEELCGRDLAPLMDNP
jgi:hypothetical protein